MPTLANRKLSPPTDWSEFEKLVLSYSKIRWPEGNFSINGRSGQVQNGVDIFGYRTDGALIGIQCKNITKNITEHLIREEVEKARNFNPSIKEFIIATTLSPDVNIQQFIRTENTNFLNDCGFTVTIIFWEELTLELCKDPSILQTFYPEISIATNKLNDHDIKILNDLIEVFDGDSLEYFRSPDFICKVRNQVLTPLFKFSREWDSLKYQFLNTEIEQKKQDLYGNACSFAEKIAEYTVFSRDSVFRMVTPENYSRTDQHRTEAIELNRLAKNFYNLFYKFIQESRAILYK